MQASIIFPCVAVPLKTNVVYSQESADSRKCLSKFSLPISPWERQRLVPDWNFLLHHITTSKISSKNGDAGGEFHKTNTGGSTMQTKPSERGDDYAKLAG